MSGDRTNNVSPASGAHERPTDQEGKTQVTRVPPDMDADEFNRLTEKLDENGFDYQSWLGRGATGHAFKCYDRALRKEVVVKVLAREFFDNEMVRLSFENEAKALQQIKDPASGKPHPNIVAPLKLVQDLQGGEIFIVMEYLKGKTIADDLYAKGPMGWDRAKYLCMQVCSGLHAAHQNGIIHRDVKPENIFMTNGGKTETVKLIDFGIAKQQKTMSGAGTIQGTIKGTPEYMPPEQLRGDGKLDRRVDVYAFGATMYEMLTGTPPFPIDRTKDHTPEVHRVALLVFKEPPKPPRELNPDIPEEVQSIILKCLAKEPKERYSTMDDVRLAIEKTRGEIPKIIISQTMQGQLSLPGEQTQIVRQRLIPRDGAAAAPDSAAPEAPIQQPADGVADAPQSMPYAPTGSPTVVSNAVKEKRRKTAMIVAGAAVAAALVLGTATYLVARSPDEPHAARPAPTEPLVEQTSRPTQPEPVERPAPQPVPQAHTITFNVGMAGVEVRRGTESLCTSGEDGVCRVSAPHGSDPVEYTLAREGYQSRNVSVVPDMDRSEEARLELEAPARPPTKVRPVGSGSANPRPRPRPQPTDQPLIRIEPNYKK
ncbi:MAG: serine/threonine-protein kinase [Candidatus Micrarchaeota archaeon]